MEQLEKAGFQPHGFKNTETQEEEELIEATKYTTEAAVEASGGSSTRPATGAVMELPLLHGGLLPEPLLAGSAVLDVLQHVAQHGPLPALILPRPLHPLVHFGTWSGGGGWREPIRDRHVNTAAESDSEIVAGWFQSYKSK